MTGTYQITSVVVPRRWHHRWRIAGFSVDRQARMEWFTTNQFLAAFLDQARHLRKPVTVTWQSIWWGEEVQAAEFAEQDAA